MPSPMDAVRIGSTHVGFNSHAFGGGGASDAVGHVVPMATIMLERDDRGCLAKVGGFGFRITEDTFDAIINILSGRKADGSPE